VRISCPVKRGADESVKGASPQRENRWCIIAMPPVQTKRDAPDVSDVPTPESARATSGSVRMSLLNLKESFRERRNDSSEHRGRGS
jgi:hypothetical protein